MTIDLDTLEAAAKAATPGPWVNTAGYKIKVASTGTHCASAWERYTYEPGKEITSEKAQANAAFIAAANPATVLELIAELRAEREKYTNAVKAYKAAVQEGEWLAYQVHKQRRRCPPLQSCDTDDIVTENDCQQCWLNAAREAVEEKK